MSKESEYEVSLPVALSSFFNARSALVLQRSIPTANHFLLQLCWVTCSKRESCQMWKFILLYLTDIAKRVWFLGLKA